MTLAKQRDYEKNPTEVPSFAINCGPVMMTDETVTSIISADIAQTYEDGSEIAAVDKVAIQGAAANASKICEPGFEPIPIGRGIVGFVSGGTSSEKRYKITIPFETSGGQRRDAEFLLRIR
ncbi:hypothetical protein ACYFX5_09235 [Bremerella sp. T1]|uniref:hypothetical protein n=1 Tax=Bremerella sp. TYQ1 TaxID=3119568 RepID=UPI001CCC94B6|nr:hypothetical protein [Bremerella volcania]UBM38436.1 hypothetical protein LA756_11170 [Bremerella volcania]